MTSTASATTLESYETTLARGGDRFLVGVLAALFAISCGLAAWHGTWAEAFAIGLPALAVPAWLTYAQPGRLLTRCAIAVALMVYAALQIHQAHGMLEMHFAVFVLLAFVLVYRDWRPIVAAAAAIAVHHLSFDYMQRAGAPVWVFANGGGLGIVLVHAAYVVFETAVLVALAVRLAQ